MVNVKHKKCNHEGCTNRPNYNFKDQSQKLYCSKHKLPEMIDVRNKRCIHNGCYTQPSFNFKDQTQRLYCSKHKLPEMVCIPNYSAGSSFTKSFLVF
jgi:hypothetical protein